MSRAFVGIAGIQSRRTTSHRECSRRNQQHFDVRSVVSNSPRQTRCGDRISHCDVCNYCWINRLFQHSPFAISLRSLCDTEPDAVADSVGRAVVAQRRTAVVGVGAPGAATKQMDQTSRGSCGVSDAC